jgi:lysozyme
MRLSATGLALLKEVEGVCLTPYKDAEGLWTCGVGHVLTEEEAASDQIRCGETLLLWRTTLTEAQVDALLAQDLQPFEMALTEAITVPLTPGQADACLSLAFSIGLRAFCTSTLLRLLNQGDYAGARGQFRRWVKVNDRVIAALQQRRKREVVRWDATEEES